MLALPKVVADFSAAGAFFAKRVAQSSLPLPSPCKCSAYLPCATCWVCTVSVPPFDDVSHFAGSMLPVSKSSQTSPGQAEAPPPPVAVPPAPACPPSGPAVPAVAPEPPDPPVPAMPLDVPPAPPWPPRDAVVPAEPPEALVPAEPAEAVVPAEPAEAVVPPAPPDADAAPVPPPPPAPPIDPASPPLPPLPVLPEGVDALGEQAANNSDTPHANARDRTVRTSPIAITRPSTWAGAGYLLKNRTKA